MVIAEGIDKPDLIMVTSQEHSRALLIPFRMLTAMKEN